MLEVEYDRLKAERKTEMEVRKALAGIINEIPGAGPDPNAPQPKLEVTLPIGILPGQRLMVPFNNQKFSFIVPAGAIPGQKMLVAVPAGIKMPPPLTAEQMAEQRKTMKVTKIVWYLRIRN